MRPLALLLAALAAASAEADTELRPRISDLSGPRAISEGDAFRAIGTSNDTILLNPAGLVSTQRYELALQGQLDLGSPGGVWGASIADSTEPVAAGLAFERFYSGPTHGREVASLGHLALAIPIADIVGIGFTANYIHDDAFRRHDAATPDAGLLVKLPLVNLAFVAKNMVNVYSQQLPRQFAGAISVGNDSIARGAFDLVVDTMTHPQPTLAYHVGAEVEPLPFLALRAGYVEDRIKPAHLLSGGLGMFFPPGWGFDLAYRHELGGVHPERLIALSVKGQIGLDEALSQTTE